jgi:hypothetical protein
MGARHALMKTMLKPRSGEGMQPTARAVGDRVKSGEPRRGERSERTETTETTDPQNLYNFPRNVFTTSRIAFSLRRYHRHCPFLVASTSPAFVRMAM